MKKLFLLFTIGLFATLTYGQDLYTGASEPENFVPSIKSSPPVDRDRSLPCLPCSIPEGEADIQDDHEDIINGGCNSTPPVFIDVNLGDVYCGRTNTYNYYGSNNRDTDWYRVVLTETKEVYLTGSGDIELALFIVSDDGNCNSPAVVASVTAPAGVDSQTSYVCGPGTWYFFVSSTVYSGNDAGADYQIVMSEGPPSDPWCGLSAVPVSNWAIYLGIFLMLVFSAFYFKRRLA